MPAITAQIDVDGATLSASNAYVVTQYEDLVETYLRKNADYGNSFVMSAALDVYLKTGVIVPEDVLQGILQQINTRVLDKQSRFYQLAFTNNTDEPLVSDEALYDTLLDWANYLIMAASQIRLYEEEPLLFAEQFNPILDDDIEQFTRTVA